jgi:LytR_cpsA_psr family
MIEEELRATFARHEPETPAAGPIRDKINRAFVRRKRRRAAARAAGVATAVLVAAAVVPVALAERRPAAPVATSLSGTPAPVRPGALNILVLGADTVLVAHVPADRRQLYLIGLSSSLAHGGPAVSRRTVSQTTGLAIDATAVVDASALARITDAVGGVEVCLAKAFTSGGNGRRYRAGCQDLKGSDAVRMRGADERDRQRYFAALAAKLASARAMTDPREMQAMLALAGRSGVTVDGSTAELLAAARALHSAVVVGISAPDPALGGGLAAATRADNLAEWVAANPSSVLER